MDDKRKVTVLYDAAEDAEKAKADAAGKAFPLAYAQVAEALEKRGHKVKTVAVTKNIRSLVGVIEKDESDVIFNLCESIAHSSQHEHNVVGLLELFGKCFTGSGSASWMLAGDKALCKKIFSFHGIPYPRFSAMEKGITDWSDDVDFPLIVKPQNEDASIGIDKGSVVHTVKELLERISYIQHTFNAPALVEEFIDGREIYAAVIGNDKPEALPILEWDFSKIKDPVKIADSAAKWDSGSEAFHAPEVFPEDLPESAVKAIQETALTAYQALRLTGYGRVDLRLRKKPGAPKAKEHKKQAAPPRAGKGAGKAPGAEPDATPMGQDDKWECFIIEVNPNCWLEKRSEFAMAARKHGMTYPAVLERIMALAIERHANAR